MSIVQQSQLEASIETPASGYIRLFYKSDTNQYCYKDDAGVIHCFAEALTREDIEDLLGSSFGNTSTINFTYNDAGNEFTADVNEANLTITASQVSDFNTSVQAAETDTTLQLIGNNLRYIGEDGTNQDVDLSPYLDDTNLSRIVSGSLNPTTGIMTLTRDDASDFTVDLSALLDTDTTDHTLLSNIGVNTHAQIDSHISDATIHFTQAAISITASQVSDFDTEVSNNTDVAANTGARHDAVTLNVDAPTQESANLVGQEIQLNQATTISDGVMSSEDKTKLDSIEANANNYIHPNHTGEVTSTGDGAQVVDKTAISNKTEVTAATDDYVLIGDASDTDNLKKVTVQSIADLGGGGGGDSIHIDLGSNNVSKDVDKNTTNLVLKEFIYRGASETLTEAKALLSNEGLTSATIEVYDFTNSLSIASHTATNGVYEIKDLGTISNLPTGDAIFQIRVSTGSGPNEENAKFTCVRLEF